MSRDYKIPTQFIAMQECSGGNSEVGDMWVRTASFAPCATLKDVHKWATHLRVHGGRLMIQVDENMPKVAITPLEKGLTP